MLKKNDFKKYVNIIKGQFALKCNEGTEGASSRENKNGDTVYELLYDQLEGMIKRIELTKGKYGHRIEIDIDDVTLQIGWKDFTPRDRFIKCLPNVDFTKPVKLKVWINEQNKTAFVMEQDGQIVKQKWTRANPGDMPEPKQTKEFDGSTSWDFREVEAFLHQTLMDEINRLDSRLDSFEDTGIVEYAEETFNPQEVSGEPF